MTKPLIAGNRKMHARAADLGELNTLADAVSGAGALDILICPPTVLLAQAASALAGAPLLLGAQDCSDQGADGARTGEISAAMLKEAGAAFVIVGHSERRARWGETNAIVRAKAEAALAAGLAPIICVGESAEERAGGRELDIVSAQLGESLPSPESLAGGDLVLAYEPIWAVGGTRTPTMAEIAEMHAAARAVLAQRFGAKIAAQTRILYGGSVNPVNARDIFSVSGVDGALVGRASLKAAEYAALITSHPAA
jgi:triosephosphate isomerase